MCGIAGLVAWDAARPSPERVQAMCDVMVHRGPDDAGVYADDTAAIGMRRLSILDVAGGHQPISNEDGTIQVVCNGEIYNFRELRAELEGRGHRFTTTGDTETIVHLYEEYGAEALEHLRGMFGLAIWDRPRRRLLLARDRVGIKPLYYAEVPGGLVFGSELKAVLQVPEVRRRINPAALRHLVTFLTTPATESIVDGVGKLDAGHRLLATAHGTRVERYWDVRFSSEAGGLTEAEAVDQLRGLLDETVDLHLRSDVPVGAFLSGGVDSSAVVARMARRLDRPVKTFSVGFAHDEAYNELPHARRVAARFGTEHHEVLLDPQPATIIEELTWHLDEPFGDSSAIATWMVAREAARQVKVVLTGDGGDEVFAGYDKYRVDAEEQRYDRVPRMLRRALAAVGARLPVGTMGRNFLRHLRYEREGRYLDAASLFAPDDQAALFSGDVWSRVGSRHPWHAAEEALAAGGEAWLSRLQYCDFRGYLPLDILTKVDRMTMAHSLEARPALLDHRVVEFAAGLAPALRMQPGVTKYVFKRALADDLPQDLVHRRKQGFAVPLARWFREDWSDFVHDVLCSARARQRGILDPGAVTRLLDRHARGRNLDLQIWTLVSFELWCRQFLDASPAPARASGLAPAPSAAPIGAALFA